ncbi:hypothetical protein KAX02_12865 [candidate division WOR-3 bacterium]|nr:hypothetical protein [candidate division WOR-3 bacterium]
MIYLFLSVFLSYTVKADSSIYIEPYTYLYGNIELILDTIRVQSNMAFVTDDSIRVWGDLTITKDNLKVYGGIGRYFFDNVYYIENGIKAEKDKDTLIAKSGVFYEEREEIYARDSLVIWSNDRKISGDEGLYNFKDKNGIIWGNVILLSYKDTIELMSDTVRVYDDTLLISRNNILEKGRFSIFSDILYYYIDKDSLIFLGIPIVVTDNDSLSGDYIEIIMKENKIYKLRARGSVQGRRKE